MAVQSELGGGGGVGGGLSDSKSLLWEIIYPTVPWFHFFVTDTFGTAHSIIIGENNAIRTFITTYKVISFGRVEILSIVEFIQ